MSATAKSACPKCGFAYAWDGSQCVHCHFSGSLDEPISELKDQAPTAASKPVGKNSVSREFLIVGGIVVLFLLGCLLELGQVKQRANWLGMRDFTTAYLAGSMVAGLLDLVIAVFVLRNHGRFTNWTNWVLGVSTIWIPVSAGALFDLLPNSVPGWLPISYLVFFLCSAGWGLMQHWGLFKRMVQAELRDQKFPEDEFPRSPQWESLVGAGFGLVYAGASLLLLVR